MNYDYKVSANYTSFYIQSNNEDLQIKFEWQANKGPNTLEIENKIFKVQLKGQSF